MTQVRPAGEPGIASGPLGLRVMQPALFAEFDARVRTFIDDMTGTIRYVTGVLAYAEAIELFGRLIANVAWRADERPMYDRVVAVPRRVANGLGDDGKPIEPMLAALQERVEAETGACFNSIGINRYRGESDSVAWHNDTLTDLIENPTIALVSLGAVRRMQVRTKAVPRKTFELDLAHGSLFVMAGASQRWYEHRVPKESRRIGERISIAFRQRPSHREA